MMCLTDQPEEIVNFEAMIPSDWHWEKYGHDTGISKEMAGKFRQMAKDGIIFYGRFARILGIENSGETH